MGTGNIRIKPSVTADSELADRPVMVTVLQDHNIVQQDEIYLGSNGDALAPLPPGEYSVRFEGEGIRTLVKHGVHVSEGQDTHLIGGPLVAGNGTAIVNYTGNHVITEKSAPIWLLIAYYVGLMLFAYWLLLDVWSNDFKFLRWLALPETTFELPLLRTMGFTLIGGLLGSILYQIRQLGKYYTSGRFDSRWLAKYVTGPLEGAALATLVISLLHGGMTVLGGSTPDPSTVNNFAAFSLGGIVGFGIREVIGWLGNLVQSTFPQRVVGQEQTQS